ncbi:MAG: pyrroloquinoline quinone-dependent dehydrogenase [Hyphococcus sp.]
MNLVLRVFAVLLAGAITFVAFAMLGGGMVWVLGGVDRLDIENPPPAIVAQPPTQTGWPAYGGDEGGARYSSLDQITRANVAALAPAWTYSTGDLSKRGAANDRSAAQATPILVGDSLVFCSPFNEVIALDPGTGAEKWRYDPEIDLNQRPANQFVCRGVAQWSGEDVECPARILMGTNDSRLIALNAEDGAVCENFGENGAVRIDPGMDLVWPGEFQITSPPVVVGDSVVVGSSISDNVRRAAPSGAVRAYDVRTGALQWMFDPVPRAPGAANATDWQHETTPVEGHANAWAPMSADPERGLVFVPTSSPSPDFYGGLRPGDNRYANSVVALESETGAVRWAFQTVHHDVWDYDLPAQPGLYAVTIDGQTRDIVAQVTKTGFVFVLDRDTGEPVLPVEERPVPQDGAPGEALSPTQPFPAATPPLVPDTLEPKDAFGITWFDKRACAKMIANARHDGLFTPPTEGGTLFYPFTGGGANWGGAAYDATRNLLVVNMNSVAHHIQLIPADEIDAARETFHDAEIGPQRGAPYGVKRELLISPLGLPCTPPPWGIIAGVDLSTGAIVWRKAFGTVEDLTDGQFKTTLGTPNFGGPIITAGGLVFIGAAMDDYLRAIDVETGREVWKGRLPGGGQATPMTYEWEGRQFVVIYAGGHARVDTTRSDQLMAFALPQ